MQQTETCRVLLTVRQFSRKHPSFPEGGLRYLIFHARPRRSTRGDLPGNGLEMALVRVGRRVLIDEAKFFGWIDSQQQNVGAGVADERIA